MHVVNTGAVSYQSKTPEKCLETAKREKKKNFLNACFKKCQGFTPCVALVDGLLGVEVEVTLKRISSRLAQEWKETYSRTCSYVNIIVAITILRATHRCIWGGRVPVFCISVTRPQW